MSPVASICRGYLRAHQLHDTPSMNANSKASLEEVFNDAESRLRSGMAQLGDWSDQLNRLIENRPGSLVAGIAIAGFLTGLVMRGGAKGVSPSESSTATGGETAGFSADPFIAFLSGAVAGFAVGPRLVDSARHGPRFTGLKSRLSAVDRK